MPRYCYHVGYYFSAAFSNKGLTMGSILYLSDQPITNEAEYNALREMLHKEHPESKGLPVISSLTFLHEVDEDGGK